MRNEPGLFGELSRRNEERSRLVLLGRLRNMLLLLSWCIEGAESADETVLHAVNYLTVGNI